MRYPNFSKALALLFTALTLAFLVWATSNFTFITGRIDSNIFSLLPKSERNPLSEKFISRVAKGGESSLVILIGSNSIEKSVDVEKELRSSMATLNLKSPEIKEDPLKLISILNSHKTGLITSEDMSLLKSQSENDWYEKSLSLAYSMNSLAIPWKDDPFGLLNNWLLKIGKGSKVRPYGDSLMAQQGDKSFIVMPLELGSNSLSMEDQNVIANSINSSIKTVQSKFPDVAILRSGVLFIAAATAQKTQEDISIIGLISTISALALIALIFRSFYAIAAVFLTVSIAFLYAVLVCLLIFPKLYLLTLAFGISLIGMSVDYCLYWMTASTDDNKTVWERRRYLMPGMTLALATTAMGYFLLAATPFPVLSQMAVFSISGLTAAWLVVIILFPYIQQISFTEGRVHILARHIKPGFFIANNLSRKVAVIIVGLISIFGLMFHSSNDDVRSLATFDSGLVKEQLEVAKILDIPSPSQFFMVTGESEEETLQRVEGLTSKLDELIEKGDISGYQSISQYVPSIETQNKAAESYIGTNIRLAIQRVGREMEMPKSWVHNSEHLEKPLTISDLKQLPIYQKLGYLWFDEGQSSRSSAVLLLGVRGQASVEQLSKLSGPGVTWIDKPQEISNIFERYRKLFSYIILVGYILTFSAIFLRYKKHAWRAVVPPILASLLTLAILTLMGEQIGLLSVIAFALLLGVGTDYGIFLLQYPSDDRVIFSISIGALMTIISFGSLSLSSVPALHSFGITLLFGISLSWILTIFFAKRVSSGA